MNKMNEKMTHEDIDKLRTLFQSLGYALVNDYEMAEGETNPAPNPTDERIQEMIDGLDLTPEKLSMFEQFVNGCGYSVVPIETHSRVKQFEQADAQAKEKGYDFSPTGMYQCRDYEFFDEKGPSNLLEQLNVCGVCLFIEDEPYNFGNVIEPTSYDGDCDDCGGDSRFYSDLEDEGGDN